MIEQASEFRSALRSGSDGSLARGGGSTRRKVAGKAQLAVSALGMCLVLVMIVWGTLLEASAVFLLTLGTLEILFQRALALFHASSGARPARVRHIVARPPERSAFQSGGD